MTEQMKTISSFCWHHLRETWEEELGRYVHIYEENFSNEPIKLGVNWSAIGTVSADEAVEFAAKLTKAAEIAKNHPVNGATVVYAKR